MAVASFHELCAGFCEIAKVVMPRLSVDQLGRIAFHIVYHGETVNLVHCPDTSPDHFFVVFEYGAPATDAEVASRQVLAVLEANYVLLQVTPPVFSRNPATGDVVLQYVQTLFDATASDLYHLIADGVRRIADWRAGAPIGALHDSSGDEAVEMTTPSSLFHTFA